MNKDKVYLDIAKTYSQFSKCQFTKVGCIAVNESGKIIATGVNGTIPSFINCEDVVFDTREDHIQYTKENEIHGEANLILELATSSSTFKSLSIYLTTSPCFECLKLLLSLSRNDNCKLEKIVFSEYYHRLTNQDISRMELKASNANVLFYQYKQ